MATPTYSQQDLYEMIDGMVHQRFAQCNDRQVIVNRAVRFVMNDIDLRSTKRSASLSPNLFSEVYRYQAPSDIKGEKLIDIRKQVDRPSYEDWLLVDDDKFDRLKTVSPYRVAFRNENFSNLLRISGNDTVKKAEIHNCNSLTANGTWAADGSEATNLTLDTNNYISGGGALNFDLAKGAATAYVENSTLTAVDLSDYEDKGSIFVWVFIPDYSDAQGDTVTNFILRWGSSSTVYWSQTVTTNNEGTTFYDGWNLLRFDWNGASETGSPSSTDAAAIDYLRLTITKSTALEADTDWRVDSIIARLGDLYDSVYYSKYLWQNSSGTYIEESSATTDLLIADTDEVEIIATKAAEYASQELKEYDDFKIHQGEYMRLKNAYTAQNPSEALVKRREYFKMPRFRR